MTNKIVLTYIILFQGIYLFSQTSLDEICTEVLNNNLYLDVLQRNIEAEKLRNLTGIAPSNPELEYHYLWSNPADMGKRNDIAIVQSFDFPTAYMYKKKISGARNKQLDISIQKETINLQNQVTELYINIVAANIFNAELKKRLALLRKLSDSFEKKLQLGETNILDYNNVQLRFHTLQNELERNEISIQSLHDELMSLNGGKVIDVADTIYPLFELPTDFDQWFKQQASKIPELLLVRQDVETGKTNEKLATALKLPKIQTGYMSESVPGEKFHGLVAGISLPIWENRNNVKYARALTQFHQGAETDMENSMYFRLKQYFNKAVNLQRSLQIYKGQYEKYNNSGLLLKALDEGQMSLVEYSYGISQYFESKDRILTMERDFYLAVIELLKYQ